MKNLSTLFILMLTSFYSYAGNLESCVHAASKIEHRLDRIETTQLCFQKNITTVKSDSCFRSAEKLKQSQKSEDLSEEMKALCFYQVSVFKSVQSCLQRAVFFAAASNHDEAIFECYTQFQDTISKSQCLKISDQLIYPAKKEYLASHCLTK